MSNSLKKSSASHCELIADFVLKTAYRISLYLFKVRKRGTLDMVIAVIMSKKNVVL